jgi:YHS domain-containing protein
MNRRTLYAIPAAALLAVGVPAFAQHDHTGHGEAPKTMEPKTSQAGAACPHAQGMQASLDKAVKALELARQDPAGRAAQIDSALAELQAARKHMADCGEMAGHEGHEGMDPSNHGAMDPSNHAGMNHAGHGQAAAAPAGKVTDPICGMQVDPATAAAKATYEGKTYYFCSADEKEQFEKDPAKYVKK